LKYLKLNNKHDTIDINRNNDIDDYNINSLFNENKIPDVSDRNILNKFTSKNVVTAEQQKCSDDTIKKYITTCNPTSLPAAFEPGQRLEVVGKINNDEYHFVVDTGATASIINADNLPIGITPKAIDCVKLITANGSDLKLLGIINTIVMFESIEFPIKCMVVGNLVGPSLIGTDFLELYQAKINFVNRQIVLTNDKGLVVLEFDKNRRTSDNIKVKIEKIVNETTLNKDTNNDNKTEKMRNLILIQPRLREIVRCSRKLIEVPGNGFCGIYAFTVMLAHENINVTAETISHLLDLNLHETPIWLEGEDISAVADFYNFNLIIICPKFENSHKTPGLGFYKPGRKFLVVFFENNHWTPRYYDKNNDNPNLEMTQVIFTHDFRSLHTSRALLKERKMLETINKVPETEVINKKNDLQRANCSLTEVREVKHILLNSNNPNILYQDRSIKPYTKFRKIDQKLPDDYDANTKSKFDINPNLDKTQKTKLLSLLQKYE